MVQCRRCLLRPMRSGAGVLRCELSASVLIISMMRGSRWDAIAWRFLRLSCFAGPLAGAFAADGMGVVESHLDNGLVEDAGYSLVVGIELVKRAVAGLRESLSQGARTCTRPAIAVKTQLRPFLADVDGLEDLANDSSARSLKGLPQGRFLVKRAFACWSHSPKMSLLAARRS
jgi:hypothetical protein